MHNAGLLGNTHSSIRSSVLVCPALADEKTSLFLGLLNDCVIKLLEIMESEILNLDLYTRTTKHDCFLTSKLAKLPTENFLFIAGGGPSSLVVLVMETQSFSTIGHFA